MTDDSFTFGAEIAPGTYLVTLTEISEIRTNIAKRGPNAGQEFSIRDWTFYTDDDQEIRDSASTQTTTRSKQYQWVTALLGGTPPPVDAPIPFSSLIGREAVATIEIKDGWPKISVLSARPPERRPATAEAASPAATARARALAAQQPVPSQEPVPEAPARDNLPF